MQKLVKNLFYFSPYPADFNDMTSIPDEKRFSLNHIWIDMEDDFTGRCGITEQCLEKIGDVVYVGLPEINVEIRMDEKIGIIETNTSIFDIKSPVSGRITAVNRELELTPDRINTDPFDLGWIFEIYVKEPNEFTDLFDFDAYREKIESELL